MEQRDDGARPGTGADLEAQIEGQRDSKLRSLIAQQAAFANRSIPRASSDNGELYRNFGDGFTRAVELAVTPVVFGAMGYGLDRWLGTRPIFMMVFFLVAIIGMLLRTWYGYVHRMQQLEQSRPWARANDAEVAPR